MKMASRRRKGTGFVLLIISVTAFFAYSYFLFVSPWAIELLEITVLAAVAALLAVLGWIGYTMATAPDPELE